MCTWGGMGSETCNCCLSFFFFACAIHEHPHTVMAGAGIRTRLHREIKDSGKRSRKTCHALCFFLSSFSLDYTLCLLCSFCACAPAMFRNLIWGGVANMQSSLDSVSLGRHPYPVRSFVNLREKGWKDGDGEGKIRGKKACCGKTKCICSLILFVLPLTHIYTNAFPSHSLLYCHSFLLYIFSIYTYFYFKYHPHALTFSLIPSLLPHRSSLSSLCRPLQPGGVSR